MGEQTRRFELHRHRDVSGVSGTGVVADGVLFPSGMVALSWRGRWPTVNTHPEGMASVEAIHLHGGASVVVWLDEPPAPDPEQGYCTCFSYSQPARDCGVAEHRAAAEARALTRTHRASGPFATPVATMRQV